MDYDAVFACNLTLPNGDRRFPKDGYCNGNKASDEAFMKTADVTWIKK
jgi:hypothetical protein